MKTLMTDRWLEMELGWFSPEKIESQARELIKRLAPLWKPADGLTCLMLSCGLKVPLVTLWSGDLSQQLPVSGERYRDWIGASYADLRGLVGYLKEEASSNGIQLIVGCAFTAGGGGGAGFVDTGAALYEQQDRTWYERHPEVYRVDGGVDTLAQLNPDTHSYASRPRGIQRGDTFASFFGDQWGALARDVGFGAIVLRDGFVGHILYRRWGPNGIALAPSLDEIELWTRRSTAIFRAVKDARPECQVAGYSSAVGGVADWRVGCIDLERIVADGAMDVFIDQTWGGAWQDFWHDTMIGWTFQLANLLIHRAQIEGANKSRSRPCKHYFLTETWDSWEPWDTLHTVPHKLAWSMWAFSHATLHTSEGPKRPDGVYLSWMNNRFGEIHSEADIVFLSRNLDTAQADAAEVEQCLGPAAVYDREAMRRTLSIDSSMNVSDFVDDQIGMLNKYGFGCITATRPEWVESIDADGVLWQTPDSRECLEKTARMRGALIAAGRADRIDSDLLAAVGVRAEGELVGAYYDELSELAGAPVRAPMYFASMQPIEPLSPSTQVHARSRTSPVLASNTESTLIYWMPQDWWQPGNATVRACHLGTLRPYPAVVRTLNRAQAENNGRWWLENVSEAQPVCVHVWVSGGGLRVLAGNLETGAFGDARTPRQVELAVRARALEPKIDLSELQIIAGSVRMRNGDHPHSIAPNYDDGVMRFRFGLEAEGFCLLGSAPRT
jgi:hypothetical protein